MTARLFRRPKPSPRLPTPRKAFPFRFLPPSARQFYSFQNPFSTLGTVCARDLTCDFYSRPPRINFRVESASEAQEFPCGRNRIVVFVAAPESRFGKPVARLQAKPTLG